MLEKKIGFIGGGNMGRAILSGILSAELASPSQIMVSAKTTQTLESLEKEFGILTSSSNATVAEFSDLLFLAVKPAMFPEVIAEIRSFIKTDCLVISIAAGQSLSHITELFQRPDLHLIRSMPNTPAMVLEAMSALCPNEHVSKDELQIAISLFESFGQCEVISEHLMDAVTGVSGSSPAYVYLFIEAMADAAVADGMPRKQAYKFAAQSVLGSAKMVLESQEHPGVLKDQVCSPSGTTIEAVASLERAGFRGIVMDAQRACSQKSREMGKK